MTNAEQIALYWKQVHAIEEECAAVSARLEEQANAIRAKIAALQPPLPPPEPGSPRALSDYYWRVIAPKTQGMMHNALFDALMSVDADQVKIGTTLRVRLPNDYTSTRR